MSHFDDSSSSESSSEQFYQVQSKPQTYDISIIKHLPEPRRILEGQNYEHQITKCMYEQPLTKNPVILVPKSDPTVLNIKSQNHNHRLTKLEEAMSDHANMKDKIKGVLNLNPTRKQSTGTLWSLYSTQVPSYARFGLTIRKSNFANVMMPINGVNIVLGTRAGHDKIPSVQPVRNYPEEQTENGNIRPVNTTNFNLQVSQKHLDNVTQKPIETVRFDSHFECGNLLYAYRSSEGPVETYDLILQNDINTKGHTQWFYFKVHNSKSHNRVKFNIVNFNKAESMFSYGIKPLVFSEKDYNKHRVGWARDGEKINYFANRIRKENNGGECKNYHTLSFEYYFREADTVYFAPSHPYTHSQLLAYYDSIMLNQAISHIVALKTVAETVGRNTVNVLTIASGKRALKDCKIVWIFGRQHPGEITASYMADGIIEYLIALYTAPPKELEHIVNSIMFKVVPMVNVDGVIHGNTRAELTGVDPNRMWKKPLKRLAPVISGLKKMIALNKDNVSLVLDLHSHSKKLGCFFYGNSLMHDPKLTKIYPTLVCQDDDRFELKNCRFRGGYETTARSVIFQELGIPQVYTVQCSLLGFMRNKRITQYRVSDYLEMGRKLMHSYINLEKTKITKRHQEIIEQLSDRIPDREDVDSARSESSLSDDEYEEIRCKVKRKKNHKLKKIRNCLHEHLGPEKPPLQASQQNVNKAELTKYYMKKHTRANQFKEARNATMKNSATDLPSISKVVKNPINKDNPNPLSKQNVSKSTVTNCLTALQKRRIQNINTTQFNKTIEQDRNTDPKTVRDRLKTGGEIKSFAMDSKEMEIQVNIEEPVSHTTQLKGKKDCNRAEMLCVVGNSLQDDFVCAYKNEVSTQVFGSVIKQATWGGGRNTDANKRSLKNTKKAPKLLNSLCSNLIGIAKENSVFPQNEKKILAPLGNRKFGNRA